MTFQRTDSGLISKYLFYQIPLIWVEGGTDIPFYDRIVGGCPCRFEDAGGKSECQKLATAVVENDYPYVVVIDGDYDILEKKRSNHRRVVVLHRHSCENYLFEKEPVEQVCRSYAKVGSDEEIVGNIFEELINYMESELLELTILDVAHYRADTGYQVLPKRIDPLLEPRKELKFSCSQIEGRCNECRNNICQDNIDEARALVAKFLMQRRFADLLPGHLVFGILRRLIINAVKRKIRHKPNIDNQGLMILLSTEVWNLVPTRDHESLRRRLRRAIREAQKQRQNL